LDRRGVQPNQTTAKPAFCLAIRDVNHSKDPNMTETTAIDTLFSAPRLLLGESAAQFETLRAELERDIEPIGAVEKLYVNEMALLTWDILRLRGFKTDIIRNARPAALEGLLKNLLSNGQALKKDNSKEAKDLATLWREDRDNGKVEQLLQKYDLDEGAIDAEAFRLAFPDLQQLDKMLMSMEARFSNTIRNVSEFRKGFARRLQSSADAILSKSDAPLLSPADDQSAA
jgi:hypothetical protein